MAEQTDIEKWFESVRNKSEVQNLLDMILLTSNEITKYNQLLEFLNCKTDIVNIQSILDDFGVIERRQLNRSTRTVLRDSWSTFLSKLERTLLRQNVVSTPRISIHNLLLPIVKDRLIDAMLRESRDECINDIETVQIEFCGILSSLERVAMENDAVEIKKVITTFKTIKAMIANKKPDEKIATLSRQTMPNHFHVFERLKLFRLYETAEVEIPKTILLPHVDDADVTAFFRSESTDLFDALVSDLKLIEDLLSKAANNSTIWHGVKLVETPTHPPSPEHPALPIAPPPHLYKFATPSGKLHVIDSDDDVVISTGAARLVASCMELVNNEWISGNTMKASQLSSIIEMQIIPKFNDSLGDLIHEIMQLANDAFTIADISILIAKHKQIHQPQPQPRLHRTTAAAIRTSIAAQGTDQLVVPDFVQMPLNFNIHLVRAKQQTEYCLVLAIGNAIWHAYNTRRRGQSTIITIEDAIKEVRFVPGLKPLSYSSLSQQTAKAIKKLIAVGKSGAQHSGLPFNVEMQAGENKGESQLVIGLGQSDRVIFCLLYLVHRVKIHLDENVPMPIACSWT